MQLSAVRAESDLTAMASPDALAVISTLTNTRAHDFLPLMEREVHFLFRHLNVLKAFSPTDSTRSARQRSIDHRSLSARARGADEMACRGSRYSRGIKCGLARARLDGAGPYNYDIIATESDHQHDNNDDYHYYIDHKHDHHDHHGSADSSRGTHSTRYR